MPINSHTALAFHLRTALEQWMGDSITDPWDDVIILLARTIDKGELDLETAGRLDFLLRRTTGDNDPAQCMVCACPVPGLSHPPSGGCPDVRLHTYSNDGKCRYCRAE